MALFPDKPSLITADLISANYETGITHTVVLPDRLAVQIALSPDGRILAAYSQDISQGWSNRVTKLELWDSATTTQLSWPAWDKYQTRVVDLAWSTSYVLAVLGEDGTVTAWNMDTKELIGIAHLDAAKYVLFSPDGSFLATGQVGRQEVIQVWRLPTFLATMR